MQPKIYLCFKFTKNGVFYFEIVFFLFFKVHFVKFSFRPELRARDWTLLKDIIFYHCKYCQYLYRFYRNVFTREKHCINTTNMKFYIYLLLLQINRELTLRKSKLQTSYQNSYCRCESILHLNIFNHKDNILFLIRVLNTSHL